jgi:glycosyltransferase involved in cell wall biosynthesis
MLLNHYDPINSSGLSLIIPAYNEQKRIEKVLKSYEAYFPDDEIIVVCNGCRDKTPEVVAGLAKVYPHIKLVNFSEKLGKGGAIIEGLKIAESGIICYTDADESVTPEDIFRIVNALSDNDGIIGSRRLKESKVLIKQSIKRRIASRIFNLLIRVMFLLDFKDTQCGAKAFKKDAIKDILPLLTTRGFEFDVELLWKLKRKGYRVAEFPVTWKHSDGSTFSLANAPGMFISLLKLRLSS